MNKRQTNPILLLSLGVVALFLTGFLLLVVYGARSYRDVVDSQYDNMDRRSLSAYIAASVKANDAQGAVSLTESAYGPVLVVSDEETGYALRYYRYEGQLMEDFADVDAPLSPEDAQPIGATETFRVEMGADGLLLVITDAGRTLLFPRSMREVP